MKIICDEKACLEVLSILKIEHKILEKIGIEGFVCVHEENKTFYFERKEDSYNEFLVLDIAEKDIWELDKFQSNLGYRKQGVEIVGTQMELSENADCYIYEKIKGAFIPSPYHNIDKLCFYKEKNLQLGKCDVYLLIPGKINKIKGAWDRIPDIRRDVFEVFRDNINSRVNEEYNSDFAKSLSRKCIGEVVIEIDDLIDGEKYYQDALIGIVKHDTGICVLEIMVQNCAIGGNKLLNYYCGNLIQFIYKEKKYSIQELLKVLCIRSYGKKRSMVFSYGDVANEEIINALANEEFPMAKIQGDFQRKVLQENIAQYDTAEVYVSEETMFEKCHSFNVFGNQRLKYHAIEIFFVELILFQDAAVDKVYMDLAEEGERQKGYRNTDEAINRCEEISFDMSKAIHFADYEQFNFPTVRKSAKNVANCFGIEHVYEKYERNKSLLESMIQANKRRTQEKQDKIKNQFLFLLSAVTTMGMLGDIFYVLYQDQRGGTISYVTALIIIAVIFGVYRLIMCIINYLARKK